VVLLSAARRTTWAGGLLLFLNVMAMFAELAAAVHLVPGQGRRRVAQEEVDQSTDSSGSANSRQALGVRAWRMIGGLDQGPLAAERAALAAEREALQAEMAAWSLFDIIGQLIADEAANNEPNEADSQVPEYAFVPNDI
jgi:hypothetical protein